VKPGTVDHPFKGKYSNVIDGLAVHAPIRFDSQRPPSAGSQKLHTAVAEIGYRSSESGRRDLLELRNLSCRFATTRAVDGVTLTVPRGQFIGVIGRSGAGKSTLLRAINRLVEPADGEIRFEGRCVTNLRGTPLREWRQRCAMIFQQFNLIGRLDVLTNVLLGRIASRRLVPAMLKLFPLSDRLDALRAIIRLGLAEQALQRANTLSGGQQQRVAIARALMQTPAVLLADEPISSLDPVSARHVMDALAEINREDGITVLCNLHDVDAARSYCSRIIGMRRGKVVFDGKPEALDEPTVADIYADTEITPPRSDVAAMPTSDRSPPRRRARAG
jgi:phosphonate transport system ATP-binding protein